MPVTELSALTAYPGSYRVTDPALFDEITATTTVEVIQEFAHVRARRRGRRDAIDLANAYVELLTPLLVVEETDLREGLRRFAAHERLGSFDSVLAAAAQVAGASALVSADEAYSSLPAIAHVIPDEEGVGGLLTKTDPR